MKLLTNDKTYEGVTFRPTADGCVITAREAIEPDGVLVIQADDGVVPHERLGAVRRGIQADGELQRGESDDEIRQHRPAVLHGCVRAQTGAGGVCPDRLCRYRGRAACGYLLGQREASGQPDADIRGRGGLMRTIAGGGGNRRRIMSGETKEVFGSNYGQNDVIINNPSQLHSHKVFSIDISIFPAIDR